METKDSVIKSICEEAGKETSGSREIIIRTGAALQQHEPLKVVISGQIDAPLRWIEKRSIAPESYIVVNREAMTIDFVEDEKKYDGTVITGRIEISPEFQRFGINNEERRLSTFDMADFIKMNRSFFETRNDAMMLVSLLRNFKAKVDKDMEQSDDRRGNNRVLLNQTVESNIPEAFRLNIPIFRGQPAVTIEVEVDIDPKDFSCALVSPEAADYIHDERDKVIDGVIDKIKPIVPFVPIIEK